MKPTLPFFFLGFLTVLMLFSPVYAADTSAKPSIVAISSAASNLVPDDTNAAVDIFFVDGATGRVRSRIGGVNGAQPNGDSTLWDLSDDGHTIALTSLASNLVSGDTNGMEDAFVVGDSFAGGKMTRVTAYNGAQPNGASVKLSINRNGSIGALESAATNLVPNDRNGATDLFFVDAKSGKVRSRIGASNGSEIAGDSFYSSISGDGHYAAFATEAPYVVDGDENSWYDAQAYIVGDSSVGGTIIRIGSYLWPATSLNGDGRYLAFIREMGGICIHDRMTGNQTWIHASDGSMPSSLFSGVSISGDGRYLALSSDSSNLVPDDTNSIDDIFIADRTTGRTTGRVMASDGAEPDGQSWSPSISSDGRYVAFISDASNLVPGDTNGERDAFVADRLSGRVLYRIVAYNGAEPNGETVEASLG